MRPIKSPYITDPTKAARDNTRVSGVIPPDKVVPSADYNKPYYKDGNWYVGDMLLGPEESPSIPYSDFNVEDVIGVSQMMKGITNFLGKRLAPTAYRYNPFAKKSIPVDESTWVRGVGKEGLDDLRSSGIVRSKNDGAYPQPYFGHSDGIEKVIRSYGGGGNGVVLTLKGAPMKGVGAFPTGNPFIQTPSELIKLSDPRLKAYGATPNWIKGFREIKK